MITPYHGKFEPFTLRSNIVFCHDSDRINGDCLDRTVTWHGESNIPRQEEEPVAFRVRMFFTQLFSMTFAR